ncbi:methyltransferase, putative [Bodo saltans]|uniref:Methyltransferase, putative n=1 Tax=Bodo saltans TaxID=75058 RepID=A0A0S4JG90_BODSA|nr:methyltransferase, putative [Bodo saltans]|eukprot:CUG89532.1 methyltransferase, putative [Bodo saltans]
MLILVNFSCSQTLQAFRVPELLSVADMIGVNMKVLESPPLPSSALHHDGSGNVEGISFAVIEVENEATIFALAARCVLVKGWHLLLAQGSSVDDIVGTLERYSACPQGSHDTAVALWHKWTDPSLTFRYQVDSAGHKISETEKRGLISRFASVGHRGAVSMQTPDATFHLFLQYAPLETPTGATQHVSISGELKRVYHAVSLFTGARSHLMDFFSLKKRPYIGTTSMPPELTFLMSNFAHVRRNDLVYDPFCGTGSSLVSCAHWGAKVFGTDMDGRVLRSGTGKISGQMRQQQAIAFQCIDEHWASRGGSREVAQQRDDTSRFDFTPEDRAQPSMITNFKGYHFDTTPERFRMNFSRWDHMFTPLLQGREGFLDAILSDPPYGVREQKRKIDQEHLTATSGPECSSSNTISGSSMADEYEISDMVVDVVIFAARALVVGGRLTFWHPTTYQYHPDELPTHPCMELEWDLGQQVTLKMTRRLVTMRKTRLVSDYERSAMNGLSITKSLCAPKRRTDDIRTLLDCTDLPENAAYQHYREKLDKKRIATETWNHDESKRGRTPDDMNAEHGARFVKPGMTRAEKQAIQIANRERNIAERERKQRASEDT